MIGLAHNNIRLRVTSGVGLLLFAIFSPIMAYATPTFNEYPTTLNASPFAIAKGSDGNLWFTASGYSVNSIGKMTTSGVASYYSLSTANSNPSGITLGSDGNMWFTEQSSTANKIGKITPAGVITEYSLPTSTSAPEGITTGPDGNMWFTERLNNKIGKITPTGTITEYSIPTASSQPYFITTGPDNNLWFTENNGGKIGKITTSGTITEYATASTTQAVGIAKGSDGYLWFTNYGSSKITKISTTGVTTQYSLPTSGSYPWDITSGPDGSLWFTEAVGNKIGRISTAGAIAEYAIPTADSVPQGITTGPDNNLWFAESAGSKIGQLYPPSAAPTNLKATTPTVTPALTWTASSGATTYTVYRNGSAIGTTSSTSFSDTTAVTGTSLYYVTASNAQGESVASNLIYVTIDKTAPNVVITTPSTTVTVAGSFTIAGNASDNLTGIKGNQTSIQLRTQTGTTCGSTTIGPVLYANLDASNNWSTSANSTYVPNGTYCILSSATDGAGNTTTATYKGLTIAN